MRITMFMLLVFLLISATANGQTTCTSCPGSFPTIELTVYFPNGSTLDTNVPVSSDPGAIDTVRQVMVNAPCPSPGFTFTASGFCPFGGFIDTINGQSAGSSFWELYLNGSSAVCGLDTCQIAPGDWVAWCVSGVSCDNYLKAFAKSKTAKSKRAAAAKAKHGESHQSKVYKLRKQHG